MTIHRYPVVRIACVSLECVSAVLLLMVLGAVFMQVVFRYVIGISVPWTEEAARYFNIWAVFLGGAVAVAHDAHLKVTFLLDRLRGVARAIAQAFILIAIAILDVIILLGSYQLIQLNWRLMATTLPVPVGVLYLSVFIYAVFALGFGALLLWQQLRAIVRGGRQAP